MLNGSEVTESVLVPFVITLSEEEEYQQKNAIIYPLSYKATLDLDVDWDRVGGCAMKALGADALVAFAQSNAKTWSKIVIKSFSRQWLQKCLALLVLQLQLLSFQCVIGDDI